MYQCYYMRSPGTSPVMLQCTSGSRGQTKGLITTVYSVEWISSPDVQTGKQTKHWLHNVLHAVPYGHVSLAYGQHRQYFSLTGQYQHLFLSDKTVSTVMDVWGIMCPLNKLYHFQALFTQHSQLDQPYIPPYFVHNQYILNSMNSTTKPLYLLQIYYLPCSPYRATLKWPLPNSCHYACNILNKMPIFQTYNFTHFHCYCYITIR